MTSENNTRTGARTGPALPERRPVRSWQDAEHNAAAWMRYWGYADAKAKPGGPDGGIDVRSARALGQVKYVAAAVGRPELQLLFGARGRLLDRQLLFFTGSSYAAPALQYALENDIALFVYGLDGSMEARNAPARRIMDRARAAESARAAEARAESRGRRSAGPTRPVPGAAHVPEADRQEALRRFAAAARDAATDRRPTTEGRPTSAPAPAPGAVAPESTPRTYSAARDAATVEERNTPRAEVRTPPATPHPAAGTGPAPGGRVPVSPGYGSQGPTTPPHGPHTLPAAPKERRPGTERMLLGLFLGFVALILPMGDSYTPQPGRLVATVLMLVIPCWLLTWGAVTKSRRRFWPVGLSLFLLHLSLAWATNAQLWQGDASDLLLPTLPMALCLLTSTLLIRWHARTGGTDGR
ncbi:restriction endonuclease [Streptomyces sp. NPDC004623]|uniref:restriction endonuclease n=1 Tax=Streptomyces sp. NPDC004623 TaxID=3156653 RepID=UPI0033BBFD74